MSKRILLVGESCKDIFVMGTCERLSPEAPCVVQKPTTIETNDGMAANVRANLLSLSPSAKIDFFHQAKDIYKIRHVDEASGQHLLRVDDGDDAFEVDFWLKMTNAMAANREGYAAFVFSDYGKGLLSCEMMEALTEIANELKVPIFCDTKKVLGEWSKNIDFIKINDKEYKSQLAAGVKEPWRWCRNLIVTRGKSGADLYGQDGTIIYHSDSCAGKVWSVAGAGDSVLAALVVKYLAITQDDSFTPQRACADAMDYAMKVAAVAVSRPGVVAVTAKEAEEVT